MGVNFSFSDICGNKGTNLSSNYGYNYNMFSIYCNNNISTTSKGINKTTMNKIYPLIKKECMKEKCEFWRFYSPPQQWDCTIRLIIKT